MIPRLDLDNLPTKTLVDWPVFWSGNKYKVHGEFTNKKYVSKHNFFCKIGAMLRSFYWSVLPVNKDLAV
jgi:hypothetical protein